MDDLIKEQTAPDLLPLAPAAPLSVAEALVSFRPAVSFTGYPDGVAPVDFIAGVESIPVAPEFAQLMRDKGLVADEETTNETV